MPYIPPEVVEQARQIDLLTYLQSCEPQELVRISGNNYTTRTHDSLKISNGKWMWWSQRIGGCNALDYLVKVKGCSFVEAVETLISLSVPLTCFPMRRLKRWRAEIGGKTTSFPSPVCICPRRESRTALPLRLL